MKLTKKKIMALIGLPFSILGVSRISVTTFFFFYIIVYFRFPMSILVQDPFSETSMYLVFLYLILFSGYFTGSNMACDYVAKRILDKGITNVRIYIFCLISLAFNTVCSAFLSYGICDIQEMNGLQNSAVELFYIQLVMFILISNVSMVRSCGIILKQKNDENLEMAQQLKGESEKAMKAQLNMLKLQLDPHFMFNSLGTLSGIIEEDPRKASEFTVRLAHIYKYIVAHISDDTVSLNESLRFIRDYCHHIEMRYTGNFVFTIDAGICHSDDEKILPLSLQLLVENAVKHNQHSEEHPLAIHIYRDGDYVCVANAFVPYPEESPSAFSSSGIGIKNLFDRYKLLTAFVPIVLQSEKTYMVKAPIIMMRQHQVLP